MQERNWFVETILLYAETVAAIASVVGVATAFTLDMIEKSEKR